MTENNAELPEGAEVISFSPEDIAKAQAEEQAALQQITNNHLQQRVVSLRALINKLSSDVQELRLKLEAHELYVEEASNQEN